jgi:hypothetical protein
MRYREPAKSFHGSGVPESRKRFAVIIDFTFAQLPTAGNSAGRPASKVWIRFMEGLKDHGKRPYLPANCHAGHCPAATSRPAQHLRPAGAVDGAYGGRGADRHPVEVLLPRRQPVHRLHAFPRRGFRLHVGHRAHQEQRHGRGPAARFHLLHGPDAVAHPAGGAGILQWRLADRDGRWAAPGRFSFPWRPSLRPPNGTSRILASSCFPA